MEENKIYKIIMSIIPAAVLDKAEESCGSNDKLSIICEAIYDLVDCWEKSTGLDGATATWVPGHYEGKNTEKKEKVSWQYCNYWYPTIENLKIVDQVCYGTKEKESCTCYGNKAKCNFY